MRGRKKKPTKLKILKGNPGKRPLPREIQPRGIPTCPSWLDDRAKVEWWRISPQLIRLGMLTLVDRAALACYCQAWAELEHATRALKKDGREFKTEAGYMAPHPAVAQQRSAWNAIKAFAAEFGLTPSARVGMAVKSGDDDELAKFLEE